MKRCIFHVPNYIDKLGTSGSQVRPRRMLAAFQNIGYQTDVVMGYGRERKQAIEKIKNNIKNGVKYDFLYSESSTMPTLLTEKHHLPTYPMLDFGFFAFCKKHNIKIGLFYRDIHWRFSFYHKGVKGIKFLAAQIAYRYDLMQYCRLLDVFYVPNEHMKTYVQRKKLEKIMSNLPPGAVYNKNLVEDKERFLKKSCFNGEGKISIFYVGGIGGLYEFTKLAKCVASLSFAELTICCRKPEWQAVQSRFKPYLTGNIRVVHAFGADLEPYYAQAMICALFLKKSTYANTSMPIKLFEYLAHTCPIIGTKHTTFGDFIERGGVGWAINYDEHELRELLIRLHENPSEIYKKHRRSVEVLKQNTWEVRAQTAARQLTCLS